MLEEFIGDESGVTDSLADVGYRVNAYTDPDARCECVADHNPNVVVFERHHVWPLGMGGPDTDDNIVLLCPTAHATVHALLRLAQRAEVDPDGLPWDIRGKANKYLRDLAQRGWQLANEGTPQQLTQESRP